MRLIQWLIHTKKQDVAENFFDAQERERQKRRDEEWQEKEIDRMLDRDNPGDLELQMRQIQNEERRFFADSEIEYNDKAEAYALAKRNQADRIMDRMDRAIRRVEQAQARHQRQKPNMIQSLWKGKEWESKNARFEKRLRQLYKHRKSLQMLREDIEELRVRGMKRLRFLEPELAKKRDKIVSDRALERARKTVSPVQAQQQKLGHGRSIWREQQYGH
ncbi:MAG: hypothetical protein IKO41_00240 [Lachnospiraceae bacterium]|nr:hypothetical protein [Lachnospiraceae bacterium]